MFSFAKSESKCLKIVRKEKSSKHQWKSKISEGDGRSFDALKGL